MLRRASLLVPIAVLVLAVAALSASAALPTKEPSAGHVAKFQKAVPGSGKGVKIGYITIGDQIPFVKLESDAIRKYAHAVGANLITCNSQLDASKALACAQTLKTVGVQVILNQQLDAKAAPSICAAGPKVPTIAIDVEQKPCQVSFMGSDNLRAGWLAGVATGKYMKTKFNCKVDAIVSMEVLAAGQVNTDRVNGELGGYKSVCHTLPNVRHVDDKATVEGGRTTFADTLTALPNAKRILVFTINDDPGIGVVAAAKSQGRTKDVFISAQSGSPLSYCQLAKNPQWITETAYFPERYAQIAIPAAIRLAKGAKLPSKLLVPHIVLTRQNIAKYYNVSHC